MTNTLPDMARDGGTCPSREFFLGQACRNVIARSWPHTMKMWGLQRAAANSIAWIEGFNGETTLCSEIRAEFRLLASRYQGKSP